MSVVTELKKRYGKKQEEDFSMDSFKKAMAERKKNNQISYDTDEISNWFKSVNEMSNLAYDNSQNLNFDWAKNKASTYTSHLSSLANREKYVRQYIDSLKNVNENQYKILSEQFENSRNSLKSSSDYLKNISDFASSYDNETEFNKAWQNVQLSSKYKDLKTYEDFDKELSKISVLPKDEIKWLEEQRENSKSSEQLYADYEKELSKSAIEWANKTGLSYQDMLDHPLVKKEVQSFKNKADNKLEEEKLNKYYYELDEDVKEVMGNYYYAKNTSHGLPKILLSDEKRNNATNEFNKLEAKGYNLNELEKWYSRGYEEERTNALLNEEYEDAVDNPIKNTILPTVLKPIASVETILRGIGSNVNKAFGGDGYYDQDDTTLTYLETLQGGVADEIDNDTLQWLYTDVLVNTADQLTAYAINATTGIPASIILGAEGGASTFNDVSRRGASVGQALTTGTVSGIIEGLTEFASIGQLKAFKNSGASSIKAILGNIGKGMATEGSEEFLSSVLNNAADNIINSDFSSHNLNIKNYINNGYSQKDAEFKAWMDLGKESIRSALSGAVVGGLLNAGVGGVNAVSNYANNRSVGKLISETDSVENLIKDGKAFDTDTKAYKLATKVEKKGNNARYSTIGKLQREVAAESDKAVIREQERKKALITDNSKLTPQEKEIALKIYDNKLGANVKLTESENETINNSPELSRVVSEMSNLSTKYSKNFVDAVDGIANIKAPKLQAHDLGDAFADIDTKNNTPRQILEDFATGINLNEDATNRLIDNYDGELDVISNDSESKVIRYATGFANYHSQGRLLWSWNDINHDAYSISSKARISAYEAGKNEYIANAQIRNALTQAQRQKKQENKGYTKGNVKMSGINITHLSKAQKTNVRYASYLADFGVNVEFFESRQDSKGRYIGENGSYNSDTHTIRLDINADLRNSKDNITQKAMIRVLAHELTHVSEHSTQEYVELREAVTKVIGKDAWTQEVEKQLEIFKRTNPEKFNSMKEQERIEYASKEALAEACSGLIEDSNLLIKMAEENPSVGEKIINAIKKLITKIRNLLKAENKMDVEIARVLKQNADNLQDIIDKWDSAVIEGIKNQNAKQAVKETTEQKNNTATNDGVQYSVKEIIGVNGKTYGTGVYLDDSFLSGLTDSERKLLVKEFVNSELAGKEFIAYDNNEDIVRIKVAKKNDTIKNVNKNKKKVLSELSQKYNGQKIKQEAIILIDELINNATYDKSVAPKYSHDWLDNYGQNKWDYWNVYIQEKNKTVWQATLNVATTTNGEKILYDISPIKKVEGVVESTPSTTIDSIPQNDTTVNNKSMQKDENKFIQFSARYVPATIPLKERLVGDALLNAQDTIDDIKSVNGFVDEFGNATLYHGTNDEAYRLIKKNSIMKAKEDGLFFSTKEDGKVKDYGNKVVRVKIPVENLVLDDVFEDELHYRVPLATSDYSADVSQIQYDIGRGKILSEEQLLAQAENKVNQVPDFSDLLDDDLDFDITNNDDKEKLNRLIKESPEQALDMLYKSYANVIENTLSNSRNIILEDKIYNNIAQKMLLNYNIENSQKETLTNNLRAFVRSVQGGKNFTQAFENFISKCENSLYFSSVAVENKTAKTVKEVIKGKTLIIPEHVIPEIESTYGSIKNFKNKLFGHKLYVALESNSSSSIAGVKNGVYIDDLSTNILEALGVDTYNGATAYEYDGHSWDSYGGYYNLEHLLNDPKNITQYSNPFLDGQAENIQVAAVEMALDTMTEFIYQEARYAVYNMKSSDIKKLGEAKSKAEESRKALRQVKKENHDISQKLNKYRDIFDSIGKDNSELALVKEDLKYAQGDVRRYLLRKKVQIENRISEKGKTLNRMKETRNLKAVVEVEKERIKRSEKLKREAFAQQHREAEAKRVSEVKRNAQKQINKVRDARNKAESRRKIQNILSEISKIYKSAKPNKTTKEGHKEMTKSLLAVWQLVNPEISNADMVRSGIIYDMNPLPDEKILLDRYSDILGDIDKKLSDDEKAEIKSLNSQLSDIFKRCRYNVDEAKVVDTYKELLLAYESTKNSSEWYIREAYDENVKYAIQELINNTKSAVLIKDMSFNQLEAFRDVLKRIITTIRNANNLYSDKIKLTAEQTVNKISNEVSSDRNLVDDRFRVLNTAKGFYWKNVKPVYLFRTLGSEAFEQIFWELQKGEQIYARDIQEAKECKDKILEKYKYNSFNFNQVETFKSRDGRVFSLNLQHMLEIYAASRRKQSLDHLLKEGFTFEAGSESVTADEKNIVEKVFKKEKTGAETYPLDIIIIQDITNKLNDNQKRFVEEMQEFLSKTMAKKGNEVSMKLYGVKLFNEKIYWPITSNSIYIEKEESKIKGEYKIKNMGCTKPTTPKASNPIVIKGFETVWDNHVNEMSLYHGLTLPLEDLNKIVNLKIRGEDNTSDIESVISKAYGNNATNALKTFIKDVNGGINEVSRLGVSEAISKFKKVSTMGSLSTIIQQPTSIVRAMGYIHPNFFLSSQQIKNLGRNNHRQAYEELKKYAPVAFLKEMGSFDTGTGRSSKEFLSSGADETKFKKGMRIMDDAFAKLPAYMDEVGWLSLWYAVQNETKAKYNYAIGDEKNLIKSGERFNEIVVLTQVYDSVFSKSGSMRSQGEFAKIATAFMAEPTTIMNMVVDSIIHCSRTGNKMQMLKTLGAIVGSSIANAMLVSFIYACRDDDEDEGYWKKYFQSFGDGALDAIIPLNYFPVLRDVVSIIQGYDIERSDMSIISDVVIAYNKCVKDGMTWQECGTFLTTTLALFGIPLKNVWREVLAGVNTVHTVSFKNKDKITQLELSLPQKYQDYYDKYWEEGYNEEECKSKANSQIKSTISKELKGAYLVAYNDKDYDTVRDIRSYMYKSGYYESVKEIDDKIEDWRKGQEEEEERAETARNR